MDVGLDQPGAHEASAEVDGLAFRREVRLDGGNLAALDADIRGFVFGTDQTRIAQYQVHAVLMLSFMAAEIGLCQGRIGA
jgi:hypothetical protein